MVSSVHHLYLHIPFCAKICPYCAFYVQTAPNEQRDLFVSALQQEIHTAQKQYSLDLHTVYAGGGTPSLLSADQFRRLAEALPRGPFREFTLEVNPATVTPAKAVAWREAGVNRISLGAQSFDSNYLKILGRQHTPDQVDETVKLLRAEGFGNISLDLMFALPDQPLSLWLDTLQAALACEPDHISCYGLTYEEDTPFFEKLKRGEWKTDEVREIAMFDETVTRLSAAGLPPYEISNFAKPGFESIHNRAYWQGKDWLGFGPSAWSSVGARRWQNQSDTAAYIRGNAEGRSPVGEEEPLTAALRAKENLMFGLRTREGVPIASLENHATQRDQLLDEGLAIIQDDHFILTQPGRRVADSIAALFS
jgi:oxygen-independent coproporphyrinogen-3 oxidase